MSVKIQINSLEALERLIGGDSELEIEIRNSIVQDFAKRYLKPLVNGSLDTLTGSMNGTVRKMFDERFGKSISWNNFQFNADILKQLNYQIDDILKNKIADSVLAAVQAINIDAIVQRQLDVRFKNGVEELVRQKVEEKLKAIANSIK